MGFECFIWFGDPLNYSWVVNYKEVPSANLLDKTDSIEKWFFFLLLYLSTYVFKKKKKSFFLKYKRMTAFLKKIKIDVIISLDPVTWAT